MIKLIVLPKLTLSGNASSTESIFRCIVARKVFHEISQFHLSALSRCQDVRDSVHSCLRKLFQRRTADIALIMMSEFWSRVEPAMSGYKSSH